MSLEQLHPLFFPNVISTQHDHLNDQEHEQENEQGGDDGDDLSANEQMNEQSNENLVNLDEDEEELPLPVKKPRDQCHNSTDECTTRGHRAASETTN